MQAAVDLSGRPYVVHDEPALAPYIGPVYPTSMTRHILESFGHAARITLHVDVLRAARPGGQPDAHHVVEAQFKAVARALREAVAIDPRAGGAVPSHEGRALMASLLPILLFGLAGLLVGGAVSLSPPGRPPQVTRRCWSAVARRCSPRPAASLWLLPGDS